MGASEWGKPPNAVKGKRGRERRRRRRRRRSVICISNVFENSE
jgi:hypothetical protein